MKRPVLALIAVFALVAGARATPPAKEGDFILRDFAFASGETLPELKLHYTTLGTLRKDAAGHAVNAVLVLHGTTGVGNNFLAPSIADALFGPGQPLDAEKYFIILPDGLGRGQSSKPSDGLRTKFPHYGYKDLVALQHQLVADGLGIDHLRLIVGTSMGGMQTWLWGETFPDFADGLMPIASQPVAATGRNYLWRLMIIDAIRRDPEWKNGDYASQPGGFLRILPLFNLMTGSARSLEATGKTHADVRATLDGIEAKALKTYDANDYLYWYQAIDDYDPEAALPKIRAKVLAVNFADDLLNPVELGRMEQLMPRVRDGAYVIVPAGPGTAGHQTLAQGKVWAPYLQRLLDSLN